MRLVLAALALIIPMTSLRAEEIDLLCGSDLLFVDTSAKTIRDGRTGETLWENTNFDKIDVRGSYDYPACKINVSEYVHISAQRIEFGYKSMFLNNCGSADFRRGAIDQTRDYAIDRITGLANLADGNMRCEKYNGKAF